MLEAQGSSSCWRTKHLDGTRPGAQSFVPSQFLRALCETAGARSIPRPSHIRRPAAPAPMTLIDDPLFYLLAGTAVILLGISKGGFFGLGTMGLPLMSLHVPPLQAAAIIIPTMLACGSITGM